MLHSLHEYVHQAGTVLTEQDDERKINVKSSILIVGVAAILQNDELLTTEGSDHNTT